MTTAIQPVRSFALSVGQRQEWLDGDQRSTPILLHPQVVPSRWNVIVQYSRLGFTHIVPLGFDHILFVLGIFLLSAKLKPVLAQVTAFTVAHSITLGLTMLGLISAPVRIVEPVIALSIVYVAVENVATCRLKPSRLLLVFAFGLLHGMGFAGVLRELGLPRGEFVPALVAFNVGVEAGQLSIIVMAFVCVSAWARHRPWYRLRFVVPASLVIAMIGAFWTVQRVIA